MSNKNLSEEHDSYLNPIKNISNGKRFSEEISYPTCKCGKLARFKIFGEYENTLLICEDCHNNLLKTGKVKPVLKHYTNEKLRLTHKIPDCRTVGFKSFAGFGSKSIKKLKKNLPMTELELNFIWEDRDTLGEETKVFGDSFPAIKILSAVNGIEYYFFFNLHGVALFSTDLCGEFVEFYHTK